MRKNWSKATAIELVEYIEQHHCELNEKLQKVEMLLKQASDQHADEQGGTLISLQEFYSDFKTKMAVHFAKEEKALFPYIREMDDFDKGMGPKPDFQHSSIKNPISQIEYDHDQTENVMFARLREITGGYELPQDGGEVLKALYDGLKDIESNIREHINVEHKILFPIAINMELQLMYRRG